MTRPFIAIELDVATRAYLQALVNDLAPAMPGVRFVSPATWHVTLAFLGELDAVQLVAAQSAAALTALASQPFQLHAAQPGFFGAPAAPRVIWVGLAGDRAALQTLQQTLITHLHAVGLASDERFTPHITLARPKQPLTQAGASWLSELGQTPTSGPAFPITTIALMRSDRSPDGAHYTRLHQFSLGR